MSDEQLGRFGHHPDPAIDFCVEIDRIEGLAYDVSVGGAPERDLWDAVSRALSFRVGGDEDCVAARHETLLPLADALEKRGTNTIKDVVAAILERAERQAEASAARCAALSRAQGEPS